MRRPVVAEICRGDDAPQPSISYLLFFLTGAFLAGALVLVLQAISAPV
jgi:hypothetical protein